MWRQQQRGSRRRPRTRGQALVEFAIILPVFILVLSGILDFGFMLYSRMTVISAAREGARAGATADPTTVDSVARGAVSNAATGLVAASITVTISCIDQAPPATCTWLGATPTGAAGDAVKVTVTYPYKSFFPLLFGSTFNLGSTVQMVHE